MRDMKSYMVILGLALAAPLFAQKNVVPVSSSTFTGIQLPTGAKQDRRILSTSAAAVVLEEEAKAFGVKINTAEVLQLPAGTSSSWNIQQFKEVSRQAGWQAIPVQETSAYGWLQKDDKFVFYYFFANTKQVDLYFGEPDRPPVLPATGSETSSQKKAQLPVVQGAVENPTLIGTWYKVIASSGNVNYGYSKQEYHFQEDGSYVFYAKTFDVYNPQLIFRKERGTYTVSNNTLKIVPSTTAVQSWSKNDNADRWGGLLKNQSELPEITSYSIQFHTFGEKLTLLLSPANSKQTKRDGPFGLNSEFPNTYFFEIPPDNTYLIELPPGEEKSSVNKQQPEKPKQPDPVKSNPSTGYTFSMTNWDDGWVSTIETDKVVVTKGGLRVHVYFSIPYDDASRHAGRDYYWDHYVTKQFRILSKRYRDHGEVISSFQAPYIEGTAIDPLTGKNCFLALYVSSSNGLMFPILAVAPDEQAIRTTFPKAEAQYESDLAAMDRYNRFAVAWPDLVGKWGGSTSSAQNYYNMYTGAYAGMAAVAMSDFFEFLANGEYNSKHQGASGMVGSMSTYSQVYKGKATVTNWEITLTNRWEGKTEEYDVWFTVVKGGRVLNLQRKLASGLRYNLVREN